MKIQSGEVEGTKDDMEWELHKGAGPRSWSKNVVFDEAFAGPPTVVASLTGFDMHNGKNGRLQVRAVRADHQQFTLVIKTWGDSWVHTARAAWIAYK
jgi:hypothetical protein